MQIEKLKEAVEAGTYDRKSLVFQYEDTDFVARQYISKIASDSKLPIKYIDSFDDIGGKDLFGQSEEFIYVLNTDILSKPIPEKKNVFVICKEVSPNIPVSICNIPKLKDWQVKDYVFSKLPGISPDNLEKLLTGCSYDIDRLDNEIKKLSLFPLSDNTFKEFEKDDVFGNLVNLNVLSIVDAIVRRDISKLKELFLESGEIDCDPVAFVSILLKSITNTINIQLAMSPTPEKLNMPPKQFYAIKKYSCNKYSRQELLDMYIFLTGIDKKLKTGNIYLPGLLDYVILFVSNI